jgi:hypothetical protein
MIVSSGMGRLDGDGRQLLLEADVLIGREPDAALQFQHESVSWRHASVRWTGRVWELQDLGSLNGTYVDTERVAPGQRVPLKIGAELRFGDSPEIWRLTDAAPPSASIVDLETGERMFARSGLIAIPSADDPEISMYQRPDGRWVAERADSVWEPKALEVIVVGSRQFRFEPGAMVSATAASRVDQLTPGSMALEFVVARGEDQVDLTIVHHARRIPLRPRAHTYLLLTLARLRVRDQGEAELPETSHGWVYQEELVTMLASSQTQVGVDIYRARRQFAESGVVNAPQIIERRMTSHEVRIGVASLSISTA